jgi:hypothetical protein
MVVKGSGCLLLLSLCLSSCSLFSRWNPPRGLKASDGEHAQEIVVTWRAPYQQQDEEGNYEPGVSRYVIERKKDGVPGFRVLHGSLETSYTDDTVIPFIMYTYRVFAWFLDGHQSGYSNEDDGFARGATAIQIGDTRAEYTYTGAAGSTENTWEWYRFQAQEGWTYSFEIYIASVDVDTLITLYKDPMGDPVRGDDGMVPFSLLTWTCPESTLYYLKVEGDGNDYNITVWHH